MRTTAWMLVLQQISNINNYEEKYKSDEARK